MFVTDLDVKPVGRVEPDAPLAEAAILLAETGSDTLVVDTEPVSEVTERDLVAALANGATGDTLLSHIPRRRPQFLSSTTTVDEAATIMVMTGRRSLVVVERGEPLGVLTFPCVAAVQWGGTSWLGALRRVLHVEGSR